MKIIATACIRAANFGEAHGGIYVVDVDSGNVEKNVPWSMDIMSRDGYNERGGDRGLRGILVKNDKVIMADAYGLMVFNKELELIKRVENKDYFHSIHEICEFRGSLWVTSTMYNCLIELDQETFDVKNCWHIVEGPKNVYRKEKVKNCKDLDHIHHLNSVSGFGNRLVFSGTNVPGLLDFETMEFVARLDKRAKHNFYEYEDYILLNDTANESLIVCNKHNGEVKVVGVPRQPNVKAANDTIAANNFLRGMARHKNKVFLGSSPARVIMVDITTGEIDKTFELSTDIKCSIHGLEILEG